MEKDFDAWNLQKKEIGKAGRLVSFHEGDIFYARLGMNIGIEQDGKGQDFRRPVVILRKFSAKSAMIIPLTSQPKSGKFYFEFSFRPEVQSWAILSQVRLIDTSRLTHKIGEIKFLHYCKLKNKLKKLLTL